MKTDFMYYRVREIIELFCDARLFAKAGGPFSRQLVIEKVQGIFGRFCEALLAVVILNSIVFFTTTVLHFENDNAIEFYWGFVSDVFGVCAASGYKDAWGYECIHI